jgi:hypothetical protein
MAEIKKIVVAVEVEETKMERLAPTSWDTPTERRDVERSRAKGAGQRLSGQGPKLK